MEITKGISVEDGFIEISPEIQILIIQNFISYKNMSHNDNICVAFTFLDSRIVEVM
jgi:hypothetical protein